MWKRCVALALLFLASLQLFSESVEVPELEPTEEYVMMGQDIMTLYQTVNDLNETNAEYKNLTNEMMKTLENAMTFLDECADENKKLILHNNFLIGTTVCSIGICLAGVIVWACTTGFN